MSKRLKKKNVETSKQMRKHIEEALKLVIAIDKRAIQDNTTKFQIGFIFEGLKDLLTFSEQVEERLENILKDKI